MTKPEDSTATPGSYGVRPTAYRLPMETHVESVVLQVSDLARSREFYEHTLGFRPLTISDGGVALGVRGSEQALIELVEMRGATRRPSRKRLGLYHVAILLPSRGDLGRFQRHLDDTGVPAGAGDHLVSEALYLQDPDNLGIEVYADRPQSEWRRRGQELLMATDPVNLASLRAAAGDSLWDGLPQGSTIGHVHLHVGDIARAASFYSETIGLDRMVWSYPGALFLAAGGYHHHLAVNMWAGADATPPARDEAQLLEWTLLLPTGADVSNIASRLRNAGAEVTVANGSVVTRDPWGTPLRLKAAQP